jgi:adenylate kinase family enzyme
LNPGLHRHNALLLVGPTGSGKTPLGLFLERHGLRGRACFHFDFGENLRSVAACGHPGVCEADRRFLKDVLHHGALLENETFYLAEAILSAFIKDRQVGENDLLVLNGLPRHVGQARDTDRLVNILTLAHLVCTPDGVCRRIAENTGKDRAGRTDDTPEKIEKKLIVFNHRTLPLIEYYRDRGARICAVEATADSSPADMAGQIDSGCALFEAGARK